LHTISGSNDHGSSSSDDPERPKGQVVTTRGDMHLAALLAVALLVGVGCTSEGGEGDSVFETAHCSGPFAANAPVHHATGLLNLGLAPDPAEGRLQAAPPAGEWLFAVEQFGREGVYVTKVLGCVRQDGVERWSIAVEVVSNGPVTGEPLSLDTERIEVAPYMLGAVSWRGDTGRVVDLKHFGGPLAAGGEATVTLLDPDARGFAMNYSGYVDLDIDLNWDEAELYPGCNPDDDVPCSHGLTCRGADGAGFRCEP